MTCDKCPEGSSGLRERGFLTSQEAAEILIVEEGTEIKLIKVESDMGDDIRPYLHLSSFEIGRASCRERVF